MTIGRRILARLCVLFLLLATAFMLTGPAVFARQGPPAEPPGRGVSDKQKDEDKNENRQKGWDKVVEKFIENGITLPDHVNNGLFDYVREALEEDEDLIPMVMVGEKGVDYIIPTGTNDAGRAIVAGGYKMAVHQTTYELWYEVRVWAEASGYVFQNAGREGHNGTIGAEPTERMLEPVTTVSWRDVVVWSNAISEMHGYEPVYRTSDGDIITDSRHANGSVVDAAVQTDHNGYRLPTSNEWEMAARWKNDTESTDGSILVDGRYWTPGSYASGATANTADAAATQLVAWYRDNSGWKTQPVGQLTPNHLGIYDMSGNAWEWTYTEIWGSYRVIRGASYNNHTNSMQVGSVNISSTGSAYYGLGFRVLRNP